MEIEYIMLTEISQRQKDKNHMIFFLYKEVKSKTNKP